ncbi:unnamed protein product [Rhodiola kirilowii]
MIARGALKLHLGAQLQQSDRRSQPKCAAVSSWSFRASRRCRKRLISCSIEKESGWKNPKVYFSGKSRRRRSGDEGEEVGGGGETAKVHCEVETVSWRERRIKAEVVVNAEVEKVWNALTDYERLADFIPNLIYSGRIPCPYPGRIWLEQRGLQRALYWHIEARVVLDLQEFLNSPGDRELHFSMVDGDFKKFEGKWCVKSGKRPTSSTLSYEVSVIPRFSFPAIFLEKIIGSDLPVNLQALARRAEKSNEDSLKMSFLESTMAKTSLAVLPSPAITVHETLEDNLSFGDFKESYASSNFGPLPPSTETNSKWGLFGRICRIDRPCMVDEVHLRRFDGLLENGGVHRCVVASITVKAPVREVWNVMTAYERLPEIVPNLAISRVLFRDNNKVRILQEGCKGLLYMVLHARVELDLCEHLEEEISFEQVEGDFDSFQGKWIFEQLGNQHTLLKYTVESKMHKDSFLSEAIMEEVIYEDLPSNLCAIRDYVEKMEDEKTLDSQSHSYSSEEDLHYKPVEIGPHISNSHPSQRRPRVPGLQRDVKVLKSELFLFISQYGQDGFMPMRKQLRAHGRIDIEKSITKMGGFRRIAMLMNLSLSYKNRKPKGYWDNLENLQGEINRFQKSWGMDPSIMPSRKTFERAGRYDIARALEKWGGLHEVSRLLSLKARRPHRQANIAKDNKAENDVQQNLVDADLKKGPSKPPYVSQDPHKWLIELKHLDINLNWVE